MIEAFIHWFLSAFALIVTSQIVPGFTVTNFWSALFAAVVLSLINTLVFPILAFLTLPITVVTFGLFLLVLNGLMLKFGAALVPGFEIEGLWPAICGAIVLTVIGWVVRFVIYSPPPRVM